MNYKTIDKKTGKEQWWAVRVTNYRRPALQHVVKFYSDKPDTRAIAEVMKEIDDLRPSGLHALPLSVAGADTPTDSRLQYRGYENDTEPIVIRGKKLPEFKAALTGDDGVDVWFTTDCYGASPLTPTQRKELQDRFGAELAAILRDPCTLGVAKQEERAAVLHCFQKDIPTIRKQLDILAALK